MDEHGFLVNFLCVTVTKMSILSKSSVHGQNAKTEIKLINIGLDFFVHLIGENTKKYMGRNSFSVSHLIFHTRVDFKLNTFCII